MAFMLALAEFVAVLSCTMFTSAAVYIDLVEHPAHGLRHQDRGDGMGTKLPACDDHAGLA